jgi:Na+-translocating ferredoxin:NAD+ oxidoreductase RnfG subunit
MGIRRHSAGRLPLERLPMGQVPLAFAGLLALAAAPVQVVIAADYMSVEDAQRAVFPQADHFVEVVLALDATQRAKVIGLAGPQPPHRSLRVWKAMKGEVLVGHLFVDEVVGRQDMITYAIGIDPSGKLGTLEVLSYRESHGGEIRSTAWRRQFDGRQGMEQIRFNADIKNIAGATLSCEHVTQGVHWLVALWQVMLRPAS